MVNLEMLKVYDSRMADLIVETSILLDSSMLSASCRNSLVETREKLSQARSRVYEAFFGEVWLQVGTRVFYSVDVPPECDQTQTVVSIEGDVLTYQSGMNELLETLKDHIVNGRAKILGRG